VYALVNNAGRTLVGPFLETTTEAWDEVIATDLTAAFHTCRAVLPTMIERGDGTIVNIASRLGQMGVHQTAAYSAAKAGLIGLTRALASEFGPRGIRVNAVAPGVTITEMTTDLVDSEEGQRRMREMPLGRFGRADEVADAVIFLLSDDASLFLGQTLNPNAGGYMP
jgi:3-oxoacyl-[acyl-carrier protein] reductase